LPPNKENSVVNIGILSSYASKICTSLAYIFKVCILFTIFYNQLPYLLRVIYSAINPHWFSYCSCLLDNFCYRNDFNFIS